MFDVIGVPGQSAVQKKTRVGNFRVVPRQLAIQTMHYQIFLYYSSLPVWQIYGNKLVITSQNNYIRLLRSSHRPDDKGNASKDIPALKLCVLVI